ncbi:hypothetical protein QYE76_020967 [Lolium multiflorum]|uniref:Retrotransposon gag domain-containing protein n=1 Tax=Lolium multiflorum TaxID=4521 RepID=A0AAD8R5V1_LOLMU|nr:hypothetical protein QYE76_020967 [Lolium multiflorum]
MAEEQITYEDLPPDHKKKYDELKAIVEAELIGSFEKTRSHDQISAVRDQFGILPKKKIIGYSKPYPNEFDLIPLPPKYRLPDFNKFSGSEGSSSVSRYLAQLGMVSASDQLRVRFISQSLTGPAFGWYTSLQPNSVQSWKQLEELFHTQYHSEDTEAGFVIRHGVNKAESSHSRGKDKEEAVPRDRPQDDNRRYLTEEEVRSIRYQRPLSVHLLNKYEQQYDRRRRYGNDDEGYRRSDANRRYRQHDRNNDGNPSKEIFSELDETFARVLFLHEASKTEEITKWGHEAPEAGPAWPRRPTPGPLVWPLALTLRLLKASVAKPRREPRYGKPPRRAAASHLGGLEIASGTCRRGIHLPEDSTPPWSPPE